MIFVSLIHIKEESKKNIINRIRFVFILRKLKKMLSTIKNHVITYGILVNFCTMLNVLDNGDKSGVKGKVYYDTSGKNVIGYDMIIKTEYDYICIVLKPEDEVIDIKYPVSAKVNLNVIYKKEIRRDTDYDSAYTANISRSIGLTIYNYLISYMKGEFDDDTSKTIIK